MTGTDVQLGNLLVNVGNGSRDSFKKLYHMTSPNLYAVCFQILGDQEKSDQVLKQVFAKVWHTAASFDKDQSHAETWLVSLARREALAVARKDDSGEHQLDNQRSDIHQAIAKEGLVDTLRNSGAKNLDDLKGAGASILELVYRHGLSYTQAAGYLGLNKQDLQQLVRKQLLSLRGL